MPGLIDAHYHIIFERVPKHVAMTADVGYLYQVAGRASERTLLQRDSTTVRDVGGPSFGVKRAIDELSWRHENDASICKNLTVRSPTPPVLHQINTDRFCPSSQ